MSDERCDQCRHDLDVHSISGCAADDEAAGWCDCTATVDRCDNISHIETAWIDFGNPGALQDEARRLREERNDLEVGYCTLLSQCHRLEEERAVMLGVIEAAGKWHRANVIPGNFTTEERLSVERDFIDKLARVHDLIKDDQSDERCKSCGHWLADHGTSGCAADDEAAMGGCDCHSFRASSEADYA